MQTNVATKQSTTVLHSSDRKIFHWLIPHKLDCHVSVFFHTPQLKVDHSNIVVLIYVSEHIYMQIKMLLLMCICSYKTFCTLRMTLHLLQSLLVHKRTALLASVNEINCLLHNMECLRFSTRGLIATQHIQSLSTDLHGSEKPVTQRAINTKG